MSVRFLKDSLNNTPKGRALLGLDVGKKTIGLAVCDPQWRVATPLETIKRTKFSKDMQTLKRVLDEYEIGGMIIGLPVSMNGHEGGRAQSVRDFATEMDRFFDGKYWLAFWDERLSTVSVEGFVDQYVDKRKTKSESKSSGLIDKLAAQIILQGALEFLDQNY